MLAKLVINNLAVFEQQEIEFKSGMNVLSGESGAGKSIIVKAVQLISGASSDESLIRKGADEAYIEAIFHPTPEQYQVLANRFEDYITDEEIVLTRIIKRNKPSRSMVGGRSCSAGVLQDISQELLSLTGQHAARRLISKRYQLDIVDQFSGLEKAAAEVRATYRNYQQTKKELQQLQQDAGVNQQQLKFWKQEISYYDQLEPLPNEITELENEIKILSSAEELITGLNKSTALILDEQGVSDMLSEVLKNLDIDGGEEVDSLVAQIELAQETLREAAHQAGTLAENISLDNQRLLEAEERLSALLELCHRHQLNSLPAVEQRIDEYRNSVDSIENSDQRLLELEKEVKQLKDSFYGKAKSLSQARRKGGQKLIARAEQEMAYLGLEAEFKIDFQEVESERGLETVEFLLAANKGLDFTPLNKGASGGELSRVNLALLLTSPSKTSYLFDEIDSGIGGQTANAVAEKLAALAKESQLLVISHLPQIARLADHNFLIVKNDSSTSVTELNDQQRQAELARLIGLEEENASRVAELIS